jgi:hypothetical protein
VGKREKKMASGKPFHVKSDLKQKQKQKQKQYWWWCGLGGV